jgi:hypothetical protein
LDPCHAQQVLDLAYVQLSVIDALHAHAPAMLSSLVLHNACVEEHERPGLLSALGGRLARLRRLEICDCIENVSLASFSALSGLQDLSLRDGIGISDGQAHELALATLPNLVSLQIWQLNELEFDVLAFSAPWFKQLQQLYLGHTSTGNALATRLVDCTHLTKLRSLGLRESDLSDFAVRAIARAPWLSGITRLDLGHGHPGLGYDATSWIEFSSAPLASLRALGLSGVRLRAGAAVALGFAPWLGGLDRLTICLAGEGRVLESFPQFQQLKARGAVRLTCADKLQPPDSHNTFSDIAFGELDDDGGVDDAMWV